MNYLINNSLIKNNLSNTHYNKPPLYTANNQFIIPRTHSNFCYKCYSQIKLENRNNLCVNNLPHQFIFSLCSIL